MKSSDKLVSIVLEIYKNIGSRITGSSEEKIASRYIKNLFEEATNDVTFEAFKCNPRSNQHQIMLSCILYCLALLGYVFYPLFAPIILVFYIINYLLTKFFDIRLIDFVIKNVTSHNVIAKFKPQKGAKNLLIFTANIDSPYVSKLYEKKLKLTPLQKKQYFEYIFWIFLGISLIKITNLFSLIDDYLYVLPFLGIGFIAYFYDATVTYEKSFGANNNLSGAVVLTAIAEYLKEHKLKNTEVWLCLFGAKESNSMGSKFFLNKYATQIKKAKLINIDSVSGGNLFIIGSKENDKELITAFRKTAQDIGLGLRYSSSNLVTDLTHFSKQKITSCTLISIDKNKIPLRYNVKDDLPQYLKEKDLEDVYNMCREFVKTQDEK